MYDDEEESSESCDKVIDAIIDEDEIPVEDTFIKCDGETDPLSQTDLDIDPLSQTSEIDPFSNLDDSTNQSASDEVDTILCSEQKCSFINEMEDSTHSSESNLESHRVQNSPLTSPQKCDSPAKNNNNNNNVDSECKIKDIESEPPPKHDEKTEMPSDESSSSSSTLQDATQDSSSSSSTVQDVTQDSGSRAQDITQDSSTRAQNVTQDDSSSSSIVQDITQDSGGTVQDITQDSSNTAEDVTQDSRSRAHDVTQDLKTGDERPVETKENESSPHTPCEELELKVDICKGDVLMEGSPSESKVDECKSKENVIEDTVETSKIEKVIQNENSDSKGGEIKEESKEEKTESEDVVEESKCKIEEQEETSADKPVESNTPSEPFNIYSSSGEFTPPIEDSESNESIIDETQTPKPLTEEAIIHDVDIEDKEATNLFDDEIEDKDLADISGDTEELIIPDVIETGEPSPSLDEFDGVDETKLSSESNAVIEEFLYKESSHQDNQSEILETDSEPNRRVDASTKLSDKISENHSTYESFTENPPQATSDRSLSPSIELHIESVAEKSPGTFPTSVYSDMSECIKEEEDSLQGNEPVSHETLSDETLSSPTVQIKHEIIPSDPPDTEELDENQTNYYPSERTEDVKAEHTPESMQHSPPIVLAPEQVPQLPHHFQFQPLAQQGNQYGSGGHYETSTTIQGTQLQQTPFLQAPSSEEMKMNVGAWGSVPVS